MTQASEQIAKQYANAALNKQTWGAILYNVKAYGVKGGGVVDDTVKAQAVIDLAYNAGGGTVIFPRDTYKCNLIFRKNVSIHGYGSTFKPALAGAVITFDNYVANAEFKDFNVVGNLSDPINIGIYMPKGIGSVTALAGVMKCIFRNIDVNNCGSHGWFLEGGNGLEVKQFSYFENVDSHDNNGYGWYFKGQVQNNVFVGLKTRYNKNHGIFFDRYLDGVTWCTSNHNVFIGGIIESNKNASTIHGIYAKGAYKITFQNCWFEGNGSDDPTGLSAAFYTDQNLFTNTLYRFRDCSFASHFNDIWIVRGNRNIIDGCEFEWNGAFPATKSSGIRLESESINNDIGANVYKLLTAPPVLASRSSFQAKRNQPSGQVTVTSGSFSVAVTIDEINTPRIAVTTSWLTTTAITATSKTGFTVTFGSAPPTNQTLDYVLS